VDVIYRVATTSGDDFGTGASALLGWLTDAAAVAWQEPEDDLGEGSAAGTRYLDTTLLCWVALDRAVMLAEKAQLTHRLPEWTATRDEIRAAIVDQGWNERVGAYTQSFGGATLDATALMLVITGFLPATDPRMMATIEVLADRLSAPCGLLYRSRVGREVPDEPPYLTCTYWLVECLALSGRVDLARDLFDRATAYSSDVGLLAEQADPFSGELRGNFPHSASHAALINAAAAIDAASDRVLPA